MRQAIFLTMLMLAGCGEAVEDNHFADDVREDRAVTTVAIEAERVRIGELGPNFAACNAAGVARNVAPGETLQVRAAPFDSAALVDEIRPGQRFAVCTRSHDQKWFGVVFDKGNDDATRCGVSAPVTARRAYEGPCRSGWVASPFVRLSGGPGDMPADEVVDIQR